MLYYSVLFSTVYAHKLTVAKIPKFFVQVHCEQSKLAMRHASTRLILYYIFSESDHDNLRSLFVHQNVQLVHTMSLDASRTVVITRQDALPSWP